MASLLNLPTAAAPAPLTRTAAPAAGWSGAIVGLPARAVDGVRWLIGLGEPVRVPQPPLEEVGLGAVAPAAVVMAVSLFIVALAMTLARAGSEWAEPFYWIGATCLFVPGAIRVAGADASRRERLCLVALTGLAIYLVKLLHAPLGVVHFDEFLHLATANDIIESGHLFSTNALLPISAVYPALEIVTSAIVQLTGLSVFTAAILLLAFCRVVLLVGLFVLFERMTSSARIASIACIVFLGNANISVFYAQYAYESLGVVLLVLVLIAERYDADCEDFRLLRTGLLLGPMLIALAATHHMTSSFAAIMLGCFGLLECTRPIGAQRRLRAGLMALGGFGVILLWNALLGSPTSSYIGPMLEQGLGELWLFLTGQAPPRRLFVGDDGVKQAMLRQLITLGAMVVVLGGLATGFLRSLTLAGAGGRIGTFWGMLRDLLKWHDSRLVCFVLLTFLFPMSLAFRFTTGGWELGSRLGSLAFFGVCVVVGVALACYWQGGADRGWRTSLTAALLTMVFLGGMIVGWGPGNLPSGYKIAADSMSIEPMGIDAATWTNEQLGSHRRFAADRINRLLLATYGRQRVITTLQDRIDISSAIVGKELGAEQTFYLKAARTDFVLVDLRLSQGLPAMGVYFEKGEANDIHAAPPKPADLLKFDSVPGVSRVYDNGAIIIYDVGVLRNGG